MLLIVRAVSPVLLRVTDCGELVVPTNWPVKVRFGLSVAAGPVPFPCKLTTCGLPAALSLIVNAPLRVPRWVGEKVTLMEQPPPAATDVPQLLVWLKSPEATMLVTVRAPSPTFMSVTACGLLLVPTSWLLKLKEVNDKLTTGAMPVPVRLMVFVPAMSLLTMFICALRVNRAVGEKVTKTVQPLPGRTPWLS